MNVLSLFDGISCGQLALQKANIKINNYFASEIDKHAIKVTQHNFPNTTQLGSVVNINGYSLPKIDLLIGGSPCQSFSFAGKQKGMSTTRRNGQKLINQNKIRRLTPTECEKLQTIPTNYTSPISDSQRYKSIGNGWTIDVISHIFSYLN